MTLRHHLNAFAACLGALLATPAGVLAAPPDPLWTEESLYPGLDPDAPVVMSAFSELARRLSPAVVNIDVSRAEERPILPFYSSPNAQGLGTGFIIHADGYILTNHHVVATAENIRVRLANEQEYDATIVGSYPPLDICLLKIEPREILTVAPLGDSTAAHIGEWVIAIGNPFGLSHTVTAGIISAKGRRDIGAIGRDVNHARFLQTDASINPGNSGGPLINIQGKVIGVNTAINSAGQGIGFAVPIDMIKRILPKLALGKVERSYLGVLNGPIPTKTPSSPRPKGTLITKVIPQSPAAKAGLKEGDIILSVNDSPLIHWEDLGWLTATAGIGTTLELSVQNGSRVRALKVTLEALPESQAIADTLGLAVEPLETKQAVNVGLKAGQGLRIKSVEPNSIGTQLGLRRGDILTHVQNKVVSSEAELQPLLVKKGRISITLRRGALQLHQTLEH